MDFSLRTTFAALFSVAVEWPNSKLIKRNCLQNQFGWSEVSFRFISGIVTAMWKIKNAIAIYVDGTNLPNSISLSATMANIFVGAFGEIVIIVLAEALWQNATGSRLNKKLINIIKVIPFWGSSRASERFLLSCNFVTVITGVIGLKIQSATSNDFLNSSIFQIKFLLS